VWKEIVWLEFYFVLFLQREQGGKRIVKRMSLQDSAGYIPTVVWYGLSCFLCFVSCVITCSKFLIHILINFRLLDRRLSY
jgi:predicted transcriptional regulator